MAFVPDAPAAPSGGRFVPDAGPGSPSPTPIPPVKPPESGLAAAAKNTVGAYIEPGWSMVSGAVAAPLGGISGLAGSVLPGPPGQGADWSERVSEALTYKPRTEGGKKTLDIATKPLQSLAADADRRGGKVTDYTGSPILGTATTTGINALPMMIGGGASRVAKPIAAAQQAERASPAGVRKIAEAEKVNEGLTAARDAGYVVAPNEAGTAAGGITRAIEGLAGEPKTSKLASKKNQPTTNDLIRQDVGLPEDVPLSREALARVRAEAGKAYENVKGAGQIRADAQYLADLAEITKNYDTAAKSFSHRSENPFAKTLEGLRTPQMDAAALVEEVKLLRADADKAYAARDPGLGKAFKSAAQALDDQLGRHLDVMAKDPSLLPDQAAAVQAMREKYQQARTQIAKTYAADKALNDTTGNINADVYRKAFEAGKPLSGEGLAVGKFAAQFPKSAQRAEKMGSTGATGFDALMATIGGPSALKEALVLGARPAARNILTSQIYQNMAMKPKNPNAPTLAMELQQPGMKRALELAGVASSAEATNGR